MTTTSSICHSPSVLLSAILTAVEDRIIPITRESFANGGAPFGAAILQKNNLEPVVAAVNAWQECPIYHGETNCIRKFYLIPPEERPEPASCIFFSTHEPCSLCLSSFAWAGFAVIYFLFTYEETEEMLGVTGDTEIIQELFQVKSSARSENGVASRPLYNKNNKFFFIQSIDHLVEQINDPKDRELIKERVQGVRKVYDEFRRPSQ